MWGMTETTKQSALVGGLTFAVVTSTNKANFLFSSIENYIHEAGHQAQADKNVEDEKWPVYNRLKMLRRALKGI